MSDVETPTSSVHSFEQLGGADHEAVVARVAVLEARALRWATKFADLADRSRSDPERWRRIDALIAAYPREEGAHRIGELRRALHVTQVELAELVDRSQSAISQIENGEIALSIDLLRSIVVQLVAELEIAAVFPDRRLVIEI